MSIISDQAIVLRRSDYSETSQIVTIFTAAHGKQRLIAKGIKRGTKTRFAPGLDLLEAGQVMFSSRPERGQQLGTLMEWKQTRVNPALRERLDCLYAAQYAAEITDQMTAEDDPHPGLLEALRTLLEQLAGSSPTLQLVVEYQRALLVRAGLWPELACCVQTGRALAQGTDVYFSSAAGGTVSRDIEATLIEKRRVSAAALTGLASGRWTPPALLDAFDLLNYHLQHVSGRAMRLAGYVRQSCPPGRKGQMPGFPSPGR